MDLSRLQHQLAISPRSLHTVTFVAVLVWIVVGGGTTLLHENLPSLWLMLPDGARTDGWFNTALALLGFAVTVYTLSELNITQILLRINSRIISFNFVAFFMAGVFLHAYQSGYVVMYLLLLSYFSLFSSYSVENSAGLTYVSFLFLGCSALLFPKLIWLAPIYWLSLYILRTVSPRSIVASVMGLLTPFWLVGSIAFCCDQMHGFGLLASQMIDFEWGGYGQHTTGETLFIWLLFAAFFVSVADFYLRIYLDKTRNRAIYNVLILHGAFYFLLLLLQPLSSRTVLPIIVMNTAILSGHFVANDDNRLTNTIVCIFILLILTTFILNAWIL